MAKILILEDDFRLTEALIDFFNEKSHEFTFVKNVDEYNQTIESYNFNVCILDSKLLFDVDQLSLKSSAKKILLIGPFDNENDFINLDEFNLVIRKPFDIDSLVEIIAKLTK